MDNERRKFVQAAIVGTGTLFLMGTGCDPDCPEVDAGPGADAMTGTDVGSGVDAMTGTDALTGTDAGPLDGSAADSRTRMCSGIVPSGPQHGHVGLAEAVADIDAGEERTYDIQGTADHSHLLTVTAEDFATLQAGGEISNESTETNGHTHMVGMSCSYS